MSDRPLKYGLSHPSTLFASERMRDLGYSVEYHAGRQDFFISNDTVASLERSMLKGIKSICSRLMFKGRVEEAEKVRAVLIEMENR